MAQQPPDQPPRRRCQVFLDGLRAALALGVLLRADRQLHRHRRAGARVRLQPRSGWCCRTLLIWAAPAQVILISTLGTATLVEVALAVTLSSVRFLPMVAALLPMLKRAGTRQRDLLLPMHLTAISVWVEGMRLLPARPRERAHRLLQRARHRA